MNDSTRKIEYIIKGMECCIQSKYTGCPENCPMKDAKWTAEGNESCRAFDKSTIEMPLELIENALAMLRMMMPREPHYTKLEYLVNGLNVVVDHPECPRCFDNGLMLWDAEIEKGMPYCKRCGQAVRWT